MVNIGDAFTETVKKCGGRLEKCHMVLGFVGNGLLIVPSELQTTQLISSHRSFWLKA